MDHFEARQSLYRRRHELDEQLKQIERTLQQQETTVVGLEGLSINWANLEQVAAHTAKELIHVKHLLKKLGGEVYGVCSNCGKPIGQHRLKAFPTAVLCVRCANNAH